MKIAFFVSLFPRLSETFILNQITGLIDRGHEVDIYASGNDDDSKIHEDIKRYNLLNHTFYYGTFYQKIPTNKFIRLLKGLNLLTTNLHKNPIALFGSLNVFKYKKKAASLSILYKVIPFLDRDHYDIIQCHFGPNGNLAVMLRGVNAIKGKILTTFHGYDIRLGLEKGGKFYQKLFKEGDLFIAISDYNYRNLINLGLDKKKIVYHPVGINLNNFAYKWQITPAMDKRAIKVITVARLVSEKGLYYGIRAIHKILQQNPKLDLEYNIIGEGPLKGELTSLIQQLNLSGHVYLYGSKNSNQIIEALQQSDIFILSSVAEALPVVLMEAQAVGLPVIATAVGSVNQIVLNGKSGFCVPASDVDALADRLNFLIGHPELWPEMGRRGREIVKDRFDINKLNDKLVEIYLNVLK